MHNLQLKTGIQSRRCGPLQSTDADDQNVDLGTPVTDCGLACVELLAQRFDQMLEFVRTPFEVTLHRPELMGHKATQCQAEEKLTLRPPHDRVAIQAGQMQAFYRRLM